MQKTTFFTITALLAMMTLSSGCTWVEPTDQGSQINLADQEDPTLATCEKLGALTTMVKHKIGSFDRSEEKVKNELATIAQNEAAEMGGDTIAPEGPVKDGQRTFAIFKCK